MSCLQPLLFSRRKLPLLCVVWFLKQNSCSALSSLEQSQVHSKDKARSFFKAVALRTQPSVCLSSKHVIIRWSLVALYLLHNKLHGWLTPVLQSFCEIFCCHISHLHLHIHSPHTGHHMCEHRSVMGWKRALGGRSPSNKYICCQVNHLKFIMTESRVHILFMYLSSYKLSVTTVACAAYGLIISPQFITVSRFMGELGILREKYPPQINI